jgi:DNA-directed RNA polymerase subunit M/transcription elongation factor TFIIS
VLEIIILTDLITKNSVSSSELVQQVKDSNIIKTNIKANLEKLSNPKINGIISSKSIIDSEKPFESVMDIIRKSLLKQYSTEENKTKEKEAPVKKTKQTKIDNSELNTKNVTDDNLKEYSQEIPNYPTFKFYFPESMGEYCKQKDNVFELKKDNIQKIRVMISKCSSEENLEADAKKWIEFNKKETSMEYVSYIKEKIKNIPIEVYELRKIGKIGTRIYKIGYVNGCRITISGGKVKGKEQIINQAFEKITWVDNTEKKVKPTNPIIIDCPACNSNFELKWNVPDTEKTFYCKCPNCGMELKRGNPNYKGKEKTTISNTNNKDKIITYLINVLKQTEKRANTSFEKLNQYEDIVNEFAGCINEEQFNYCDNGIMVEGYTAKSLKEKVGNKLNNLGVYNYLIYLRENPDEAKQNLAKGLPVK